MSKKKSILVATIGTRDLAFCVSSNEWLNPGDSYVRDSNSISEQAMVQMELALEKSDFRQITQYLYDHWKKYKDQVKPIILGKLLEDKHKELQRVYLVATDQTETVKFRDKDTLYSAYLIQHWIESHYQIETQVILQGSEGDNPADFEAMFRWWKRTWQEIAAPLKEGTPILLCVKGGVGAFSEAGRVSALSRFGEDTLFFDFIKDDEQNRQGYPSAYTLPLKGLNYLWDRRQQEALSLLDRFDYEAVQKLLNSYFNNADVNDPNCQLILRICSLLKAAIQWNQAEFQGFATSLGNSALTRSRQWWWLGYEAAYLGIIRYKQGNTVEAMFHTFRAVEGLMSEWAIHTFPNDVVRRDRRDDKSKNKVPLVKKSIARSPDLSKYLNEFKDKSEIALYGHALDHLVQIKKPEYRHCSDINKFWDVAKEWRNQLFHRLLGLDKSELFWAWDTETLKEWENRVLGCLNFLAEQQFDSLAKASLMFQVHEELKEAIASYQP
ncbi:hypothetical protein NG791_20240 [Laspinema sp. D1]|uniref:hypothetical protein n=1 Tax=Laspinema palackyanum TaxID=3231601 RepID=UPI00348F95A3|nr:hypothetical protein [Laspinema sp. D2b]